MGPQVNNVRDTIAVALNSGSSELLSALTTFFHCSELRFLTDSHFFVPGSFMDKDP